MLHEEGRRFTTLCIIVLTAAYSLSQICFSERFFIAGGLGWDGQDYGAMAARFPEILRERSQSPYRLGRFLPSAVVNVALRVLQLPMNVPNVVNGFLVLNGILLVVAAWLWTRIARVLDLSVAGAWIGFVGLFGSHGILKMSFYAPVNTDVTVFALSLAMVHAYLTDRPGRLLAAVALGSWTWPTMLVLGSLLYVFPRRAAPGAGEPRGSAAAWSAVVTGVVLIGGAVVLLVLRYPGDLFAQAQPVSPALLPLSAGLLGWFFFKALKGLLDAPGLQFRDLSAAVRRSRILPPVLLGAAQLAFIFGLGSDSPSFGLASLQDVLSRPFRLPLVSFVGHVVYFGPIVVLLALRWTEFCRAVHSHGAGLSLFMTAGLLLALGPDSRQLFNVIPVAVVILAQVLDRARPSLPALAVLAGLCLLFSKIWYPINHGEFPPHGPAHCMEFPWQRLFMNGGQSMSAFMFGIQAPAVVALGVILAALFRRPAAKPTG